MDKWIPVEERLPEPQTLVIAAGWHSEWPGQPMVRLVTAVELLVGVDDDGQETRRWLLEGGEPMCECTHWMPFPQPPEVQAMIGEVIDA